MSGTQSALFSSGGNRWITNPKQLPLCIQTAASTLLKTATGTNAAISAAWSNIAAEGASTSIVTADTYVTVANLTGAGFLFNAFSPSHSSAFRPTIRLTVDGTVYTISPTADVTGAAIRMILGAVQVNTPLIAAGDAVLPNNSSDPGFAATKTGGITLAATSVGVMLPQWMLVYGYPVLRFESSLLIEMKTNILTGVAAEKICGATYRLDL